jgi:8-oxo-dGTP pyrophosphatase MutT (NUDIX family)
MTLELCAGIVDKSLSLVEIAQEEILEECGYKVMVLLADLKVVESW